MAVVGMSKGLKGMVGKTKKPNVISNLLDSVHDNRAHVHMQYYAYVVKCIIGFRQTNGRVCGIVF